MVAEDLAERLTGIAKALFYKERSWEAVLERAANAGLPAGPLRAFTDWLAAGRIDQRRRDAKAMLSAIRAHLAAGAPLLRVNYTLANTVAWEIARRT